MILIRELRIVMIFIIAIFCGSALIFRIALFVGGAGKTEQP